MRRRLATCVALAGALLCGAITPAPAGHTPLNPDNAKWRATADNDFNLEVAFTATYPGGAFRDRVRDVVAQDPSCSAGSCSAASYSHWYLHRAQPYFGSESAIADADPSVCPSAGQVAFHWRNIANLGETILCFYPAEPTRAHSATVTIDADPASAGSPAPGTWYTRGPGDDVAGGADVCAPANPRPGCVNQWDLMSVVAHEVGHVVGFGHYQESSPGGPSIDPVCLDGSTSGDPSLGDNTNRETMCTPQFRGTERQRTPEEHEKEAFANLYPPTGPAPTITPATQSVSSGTATWAVSVPRDPARATSFHMIYGDGTYDTRAVAQGTGSATFTVSHPFASIGTYTQRATIVETGASATSATARTQLHGTAFNGSFTVAGGGTGGSGSVTANGTDAQGVPGNTQTVSGATGALKGKTGSTVTVSTGNSTNGTKLPANTYSINYYNSGPLGPGYEDHSTWATTCATGGPGVTIGTVTVGSAGTITSTPTTFTLPASIADTGTEESAVCISDALGAYGNQAPVQVI